MGCWSMINGKLSFVIGHLLVVVIYPSHSTLTLSRAKRVYTLLILLILPSPHLLCPPYPPCPPCLITKAYQNDSETVSFPRLYYLQTSTRIQTLLVDTEPHLHQ